MDDGGEAGHHSGSKRLRGIPGNLSFARSRAPHQAGDFISTSFEGREKCGPDWTGNTADKNSRNHVRPDATLPVPGASQQTSDQFEKIKRAGTGDSTTSLVIWRPSGSWCIYRNVTEERSEPTYLIFHALPTQVSTHDCCTRQCVWDDDMHRPDHSADVRIEFRE